MSASANFAAARRRDYMQKEGPALMEKRKKVEKDATLFPEDRQKALMPIDAEAEAKYHETKQQIFSRIEYANKQVLDKSARAVVENGAFSNPRRVAETAAVIKDMPLAVLERFAAKAATEQDAAAGFAIRQAAVELAAKGENVSLVTDALLKIGEQDYRAAVSDLVGAQKELAHLESFGPYLDPMKVGPLALLDAGNRVGIIPLDESGSSFTLPSLGQEAMCEEAGVPITKTQA